MDPSENAVILKMVISLHTNTSIYWIGLNDTSGTFLHASWISSNHAIGNWIPWVPNFVVDTTKLCAGSIPTPSTLNWLNLNCSDQHFFICQLDLSTPNDLSNSTFASYIMWGYPLPPDENTCKPPDSRFSNTCFSFHKHLLTWSLSRDYCALAGKQLVQFESMEKLQAIKSLITFHTETWIGLISTIGYPVQTDDFSWIFRDPYNPYPTFSNWEKFVPVDIYNPQTGLCVTMKSDSLKWNNRRCTSLYPFICQQELACPTGWRQFEGKCYMIVDTAYSSWQDAFAHCQQYSSGLAIIRNKNELKLIENFTLSVNKSIWIALKANRSSLQWIDRHTLFIDRIPSLLELCLVGCIVNGNISWRLEECYFAYNYYPLCQKAAKTIPAPIPQALQNLTADNITESIGKYYFPTCPYNWMYHNKHCYRLTTTIGTYSQGETECHKGILAYPAIMSMIETELVVSSLLHDGNEAWIGLQFQSNTFKWYGNKAAYNYSNWDLSQPNLLQEQNCAVLKRTGADSAYWYRRQCNSTSATLCEKGTVHLYCPKYWTLNGSSCVKVTYLSMSFYEARGLCGYHRSDLITLASASTENFILDFLSDKASRNSLGLSDQSFWIGLYKSNNIFRWLQDVSVLENYEKLDNNPGNYYYRCVALKFSSVNKTWIWARVDCLSHRAYPICRKIIGSPAQLAATSSLAASTSKFFSSYSNTINDYYADSYSLNAKFDAMIDNYDYSDYGYDDYDDVVDNTGLYLAQALKPNQSSILVSYYNKRLERLSDDDIYVDMRSKLQDAPFMDDFDYPLSVNVPTSAISKELNGKFRMAVGIYETRSNQKANSLQQQPLKYTISCSIRPLMKGKLKNPVVFNFKINQNDNAKPTCAYWKKSFWATDGLEMKIPNETIVQCLSYHLTSFSVLLQFNNFTKILSMMTYTGLSMSLICLMVTFITFTAFGRFHSIRGLVHANLSASMIISTIIFIIGIQWTEHRILCQFIAIILQFSLLASFTWMLIEGIVTFKMSVNWLEKQSSVVAYIMIGWGIPCVIVLSTFLTKSEYYGSSKYCWIEPGNHLFLIFGIPVLVIIGMNLILMALITKSLIGIRAVANMSNLQKVRVSFRASVALVPLLGITWTLGFLSLNNTTLVFSYLFVILNSLQGVSLFYFHCYNYKGVKKFYLSWFKLSKFPTSSVKVSDTASRGNFKRAKSAWSN
ncbi:uncharacterized protein TRIADDRAFT_59350 [Trichoplax adhaerens]|uniref:Uncharacterized protein n=1 Tax=Trichoplax adhaerens TaxID=10228 RepID=B3S4U5_TRIAD|nr:hypothetical protein TRIADDRAFT_59350 [Trichoplax adhaerens]EDV22150.1 hypothetical protein TRIADDRAFT_59350 [Trichoplax adhaerens]|eukprot:XP_002115305.1 hypothetical protein TRIADDRAFT_59350 [Trichoplax adhaerens]